MVEWIYRWRFLLGVISVRCLSVTTLATCRYFYFSSSNSAFTSRTPLLMTSVRDTSSLSAHSCKSCASSGVIRTSKRSVFLLLVGRPIFGDIFITSLSSVQIQYIMYGQMSRGFPKNFYEVVSTGPITFGDIGQTDVALFVSGTGSRLFIGAAASRNGCTRRGSCCCGCTRSSPARIQDSAPRTSRRQAHPPRPRPALRSRPS